MTDVGVKYDRFFVTSVMGFGVRCASFVVRRCLRCGICFRFQYGSCQVGQGRTEVVRMSLSCCRQWENFFLEKVRDDLYWHRGDRGVLRKCLFWNSLGWLNEDDGAGKGGGQQG